MSDDQESRMPPKRAFFVPALAASFFVPISWLVWRVAEWRARSVGRFFGAASTYQALFFGTLLAFILILVVAPPLLWLFRVLRLSLPVQIVVGVTIAALVGAAVIHLDPAFPKPFLAARFEGVLTGLSSGSLFWFLRSRMLCRRVS